MLTFPLDFFSVELLKHKKKIQIKKKIFRSAATSIAMAASYFLFLRSNFFSIKKKQQKSYPTKIEK